MRRRLGIALSVVLAFAFGLGSSGMSAASTTGESVLGEGTTAAGFRHPGVLVDRVQLNYARAMVLARREPWLSAYRKMRESDLASLDWVARPRAVVECGPYSTPNLGCTEERTDANAAYTHALQWYLTKDPKHAEKAIELMDAWSAVLVTHTNHNARLQTAWAGANWSRAAELIKWTYPGEWSGRARFDRMLRTIYLPTVLPGVADYNGNWELIMMAAAAGIAVYLDDRESFEIALDKTRARVPAYIYLATDGPLPKPPPGGTKDTPEKLIKYWQGQSTFVDGLAQETCRDFGHTGWGFEGAAHVAEIAWLQGVDLYSEFQERLVNALEFHAAFDLGEPVPGWLCNGVVKPGLGPTLEIAYHHYVDRKGLALPKSLALIESQRPYGTSHFLGWETLTHARNVR